MPISVPLRVSMSGGEKGKSRAREEVSSVRHSPTALRASGSAESIPSRWRKASGSSLPRVAAKWAFARCVISLRESASSAWRVTERDEWKRRSRPRCTSSRRRVTSSRAISASGDMVRPRRSDRPWADSKRTFCHSSVRAAWSAGIGPRWTERSMGAPAAMRPWRKPGASDRGHLPRCRERASRPPTRTSRRSTSTSTGVSSSDSAGEPPRAAAMRNIRSWRPLRGCTDSPDLRQQAAQVVGARELADGVEAPVQDAVARFQTREQTPEGLGRRPRLRGQVRGLGRLQVGPQPFEARRVLAHQQLRREVEGVERAGEGPELRLVELEPHHLADADLHAVKAHRPVLLQVGEHEALRQRERPPWASARRIFGLPSLSFCRRAAA